MIDPLRLCLALGPVAIYVMLIGAINTFRRPFLVSGTRDVAALGLAVSGLMIVGPIELFCPVATSIRFGSFVWVFLVALYALGLVLVLLMLRHRLVIYNISSDELRPVLADLVAGLDEEARWAGDSLALPNLKVQLHLECYPPLRNVSLVAVGLNQSQLGWERLERDLRDRLSRLEVPRNPLCAISFLSAGGLLAVAIAAAVAYNPQAVAQSLFDMLRF